MSLLDEDPDKYEFVAHQNDADDARPASFVEDRSPGLGDIVLLIGHIRGRHADAFIELNRQHIWSPPVRDKSQGTDYDFDDEGPEPWRGNMLTGISLDGPILCHSFLKPPKRSMGWSHGAETNTSMQKGQRPCDFMYPHNVVSGISSSMFRTDLCPGPDRTPTPRVTPYARKIPMRFEKGSSTLRRLNSESVTLDKPAKIYLMDDDPDCLNFWAWTPTRNRADLKVFRKHADSFYARQNRLDEDDIPDIESAGGSTMAPSPAGFETRTGLSGTEYQRDGRMISHGSFRNVFPVRIIDQPRSILINTEQTAIQRRLAQMLEQEPKELRSSPHEVELVAKEVRLEGDDNQSQHVFHEMLKVEAEFLQNYPHIHINPIFDMAYREGARPWMIEQRQEYRLDDEVLPYPINKLDMTRQLICGLKHCHDHGHMNRDIKPENVLLQLLEYRTEDTDLYRWVAKYTDWGMVASTGRRVRGIAGSPWYCAPEVLDGEPYNEKADISSLGVLLLCMLAEYDPHRARSDWYPTSSSDVELWMRGEVDQIIEEDCPQMYRPLVRGMLLKDPRARWSVNQCWVYVLELDESQTSNECSAIALSLPWTKHPFLEEQQEESGRSKNKTFKRDEVAESEEELSDRASTVTPAAPGPLPDDSRSNADVSQATNQADDVPATPTLSSCAAQLPVTPCLGGIEGDGLPSAFCTPDLRNRESVLAVRKAEEEPEFYDFSASWDWGPWLRHNRLPARRAAGSAFNRPTPRMEPGLQLGIFRWDFGYAFDMFPKTSRPTETQQYLPSQQLTKNMASAIQSAGAQIEPPNDGEDTEAQIEPPNDGEDTEAETEIDYGNGPAETPADADGGDESEAETEIGFEVREAEAPFSSPGEVQANARTDLDRENEQREAPDDLEPIGLLQPAQIPSPRQVRKRRPLVTTQPKNNKKLRYATQKVVNLGRGRLGNVIR